MNHEKMLRNIRRHPALWGDMGQIKETQAIRIRDKLKAKIEPGWRDIHDNTAYNHGLKLLQRWT